MSKTTRRGAPCTYKGCDGVTRTRGYCAKHYTRLIRYGSPDGFKRRPTKRELFWAKVHKTDSCWLWTATDDGHGYGHFQAGTNRHNARSVKAHRWAYEDLVGPIPEGMVLDHLCHVPRCVNPDHLRVVSQRVNSQNRGEIDPRSTTGYRGVTYQAKWRKYRAYVGHNYRQIHLGMFDTAEEAAVVAAAARAELYEPAPQAIPTDLPAAA